MSRVSNIRNYPSAAVDLPQDVLVDDDGFIDTTKLTEFHAAQMHRLGSFISTRQEEAWSDWHEAWMEREVDRALEPRY